MLRLLALLAIEPTSYALDPTDVIWDAKPTGEQMGKIYPPDTRRFTDLRVTIYCTANPNGSLRDCFAPRALEDDHRVQAVLRSTRFFRIGRLTRSGAPTAGRTVRILMHFKEASE